MSNIFKDAANNAGNVEERLLGPTYPYYKNINMPEELGMSTKGSLSQLAKNINGLIGYAEILATGDGDASKTGNPLGNKFFLQTGGKCNDIATNTDADRYIYINNVPDGNIPFISSGMGMNFKNLKGLIPGIMSNMNVLNPFAIIGSFMSGSNPDCQSITMETIDNNNVIDQKTQFVALADIRAINACSFPNGNNPVTGLSCVEKFENEKNKPLDYQPLTMPDDPLIQLYFGLLSILGVYVLCRIIEKKN